MNLYKQNDTLGITFFQVPVALFASKKYSNMSLQAKVAYGLMLNRLQLSNLNGWVNENKEVYIIYTRDQMGQQLNLSYKSIVAVFKELKQHRLIEEHRRGNGLPNHIYLSKVEVSGKEAEDYCEDSRCEDTTGQTGGDHAQMSCQDTKNDGRYEENTDADMSKGKVMTCKNDRSECVDSTGLDVQNLHPSYIDFNQTDMSDIESSQSVSQGDENEIQNKLDDILAACELARFPEQAVLTDAVERMYYAKRLTVGHAVIPGEIVRKRLEALDDEVLQLAYEKIRANTGKKVRNSTGYIMSVIYNTITELEGGLMTDPYLNTLHNQFKAGGNAYVKT